MFMKAHIQISILDAVFKCIFIIKYKKLAHSQTSCIVQLWLSNLHCSKVQSGWKRVKCANVDNTFTCLLLKFNFSFWLVDPVTIFKIREEWTILWWQKLEHWLKWAETVIPVNHPPSVFHPNVFFIPSDDLFYVIYSSVLSKWRSLIKAFWDHIIDTTFILHSPLYIL